MNLLSVSQVARQIETRRNTTIPPKKISDLFYARRLDNMRCPIVGRTRLIPEDYVPAIENALFSQGAN